MVDFAYITILTWIDAVVAMYSRFVEKALQLLICSIRMPAPQQCLHGLNVQSNLFTCVYASIRFCRFLLYAYVSLPQGKAFAALLSPLF